MKLYYKNNKYMLYEGSMLDMLDHIDHSSIDSIVTDPPYELNFMNKGWDNSGVAFQSDTWKKCYEVLKPGGYLLAFGGSRTFHRIAVAIEDAGFEIRDTIMWLYGSGFPKSMNLGLAIDKKNGVESKIVGTAKAGVNSKAFNDYQYRIDAGIYSTSGVYEIKQAQNEWDGWGTCLKPAYEPIIVARKPCDGSVTDNVLKYGVGGLNIDECRVDTDTVSTNGRFPANVILTYDETDEQEVCGNMPYTERNGSGITTMPKMGSGSTGVCNYDTVGGDRAETNYIAPMDSGSAARYFYCAKASKKDRDEGLGKFNALKVNDGRKSIADKRGETLRKNTHPTVKPMELMQYLIKLVTPKNGIILDPFNGSGSTGKAVVFENRATNKNYKYIGIELNKEYLAISKARIDYANTVNLSAVNKTDIISENTSMLF